MTRVRLPLVRLLAAAFFALLCLMIPLDAGAQANLPGAPTIDKITARAGWLLVKWEAPTSDGGSAITAYDLRHIKTSEDETVESNWMVIQDVWTGGGELRYALRGLDNGTEYDVQMRAVNTNGDGDWSSTETGTPEISADTTPTVTVRADDTALAVIWTAPNVVVDPITAYDVQYRLSGGSWMAENDVWAGGRLEFGITGLINGTEYDVQVQAVDSFGVDQWSATISATPADFGDSQSDATELTLETESSGRELARLGSNRFWGNIDSSSDEDYFKLDLTNLVPGSNKIGFWIYTLGGLDTVGELLQLSSDGMTLTSLESDDYGAVLPDPENFFMWKSLSAGTYYLKVEGYGSETGDYVLRVRTFKDTTRISDAVPLQLGGFASGTIDPESDDDYFKLELSEQTDVILRASGFPDTVGALLNSGGSEITSNDDGLLLPGGRNFLIRRSLSRGTYYLKVSSYRDRSDGPYSVYAYEATEPGSSTSDAQPLTLGEPVGGNISSTTDEDYFSITVSKPTYVRIWTARNNGNVDTDGELLNNNGNPVQNLDYFQDFSGTIGFGIEHKLETGTYYVKVTGDGSTGKYTIRASEDIIYQRFVDVCSGKTSSLQDKFAGCQWHLKNTGQFTGGAGQDINVDTVWPDYKGEGITVAVVDDGMHHQHEDLHENVAASKNHDYTGGGDIYDPVETHGTAVAGIIAARDNSTGMRGVAPQATIYGYNYLVGQSNANEANAMSRNAATTAISNNSWGPGDYGGPEPATKMWETAVRNGVNTGYGGKGVFYAWAAGNGAEEGDYSTLDEYNNYYAVTSVCAVNYDDKRTSYSEAGANLWVCAPSSDRVQKMPGIATTDNGNRYRDDFGGTSAATPIVAGVAALIRDANDTLTWRDVKLILAASARKNDTSNSGWEEGAAKYGANGIYQFNHEYGFGVVDAQAAVDLALMWTNVPTLRDISARSGNINLSIPDATMTDVGSTVTSSVTLDARVDFIEYIQVDAHFSHDSFRDLDVVLVSPSGAESTLTPRFDTEGTGLRVPVFNVTDEFRFGSAKHLGEDAAGEWTLRITDHYYEDTGTLIWWKVTAYGHGIKPLAPDIDEVFPASGGFTVTWKAPSDTGGSDITRYEVRYILSDATDADKTDDSKWTEENAGNPGTLQYTASGLTASEQYDVQVRAVNDGGESPWSETATVTPTTADAPTIESITPGDGMLTVAWTAPGDTGLGIIDSYDLRYGRGNSPSTWTVVDDAWTTGNLEYTINPTTPLSNGVTYGVQVRAVVGTDEHQWSTTRTGTPRTMPGAPTIDFVDGDDGKLSVEWTDPSDNGGADVTSYDVRYIRSDAADKTNRMNWMEETGVWDGVAGNLKYVASGLVNWVKYDVQVRAENPAGAGAWSATDTGTPINSVVRVTLKWEMTSVDVDEDGGTGTLTAIAITDRDEALPSDFFFDAMVETAEGTAVDPDDYIPSSATTLTFNDDDFVRMEVNGQQRYRATMDFTVTVFDDTDDESDETFTAILAYANPDIDNLRLRNSITTVTIKDDEHVPVNLGWLDTSVSVNEGRGTVTLNATATTLVDKRPETGFSFQATVFTSAGSADPDDDYTDISTTVTFQQSDFRSATVSGDQRSRATKRITVPIIDDMVDEQDEDFTATVAYAGLSQPHLQGGPATATVIIEDNDLPRVTVEAVTTSAPESGTLTFELEREGITDDPLTVNVRVSETGRILASGQPTTASFLANSGTTTLDVTLDDDTEDEDNSTVTVAVRSGTGYVPGTDASATATALDDDHVPVTLSWDRTAVTVAERASTVTLRAVATTTEDKQPESGFSFGVTLTTTDGTATNPADYSLGNTTATFSQSDFTRTTVNGSPRYRAVQEFTVNIVSGDGNEVDETFTATLAYADPSQPHLQGGSATATVTISDNDEPLVSITEDDSSATEEDSSIAFTLTRDGQTTSSLRVNVRVTETGNMLARGAPTRVTFAANSDTASLQVNLAGDTEDEDDSTVTVEVVDGSGYLPGSSSSAQTAVSDDDHVPVTLQWEETAVTVEEGAGTVNLTAIATTSKDKRPENGSDFNATVTVADGSAIQLDDYSPPSSDTLTFSPGTFAQETVDGQSRYQATRTFTLRIEDDDDDELDENFTVRLVYETPGEPHLRGGNSTARVTITDDDPVPLVLGWERPVWSVEESDGTVTLKAVATTTINRMPEEGFSFDATVTTSNGSASQSSDYTRLSVTETFLRSDFSSVTFDGQRRYRAEKEFDITVEDDSDDSESNEDFSVRLGFAGSTHSNLTTGITDATVWIIEDDDSTADVQLTRNSSPGSVSEGATLTYTYTVKNNGPAKATGVTLISVLDDNIRVNTPNLPSECRHSGGSPGGEVNCGLGTLADDETKDVSVEATVESVPNDGIVNRAHVTSFAADPTPGNNTYPSSGSRPVLPPTTGGGGGGGSANRPPVFQDPDGNAITETLRGIVEDAALDAKVGEPVVATDPDEDTLTYTVGGDDAASFTIDASTGQLTTNTALDHEAKASYSVTVIATDPSGATAEIQVTITVTEVVFDCSSGGAVADAAGNPDLVSDCEALLSARDKLSGSATLNWSDDTPITEWDGVSLGGSPQRVSRLYLVRKGLSGTIPADLSSLLGLEGLYLHSNELTGRIPPQLSELSSLIHLTLHRNRLVGEIPAGLGDLNGLVFLSLYGNELTGELPAELGSLSNLRWLYLQGNKTADGGGLSGPIPSTFRNLGNLERLMLYGNSLSGTMPVGLGDLSDLKSLLLHDNELTGQIPSELGNMSSLRYLWLDDNDLSGVIPAQLGNLSNLRWLSLYGNSLSGPIPGELGDLSALRLLMLDRNDLSGTIPSRLGELSALTWLNLNDNDLSGPIPGELGDLSNLEHLYLHGNGLTGPVPADLGRLTNLTNLWLRDNRLSGQIPPSLGDLPNLQRVRIRGNAFTGCIPSGLLGGPGRYSDAEELRLPACVNDNVVGTP